METGAQVDICRIESREQSPDQWIFMFNSLLTGKHFEQRLNKYSNQKSRDDWLATKTEGSVVALFITDGVVELDPVTVAFDLEIADKPRASGYLDVIALPRPSPLLVATDNQPLINTIKKAVDTKQGMAFALSDHQQIAAAVQIDLETAYKLNGMTPIKK